MICKREGRKAQLGQNELSTLKIILSAKYVDNKLINGSNRIQNIHFSRLFLTFLERMFTFKRWNRLNKRIFPNMTQLESLLSMSLLTITILINTLRQLKCFQNKQTNMSGFPQNIIFYCRSSTNNRTNRIITARVNGMTFYSWFWATTQKGLLSWRSLAPWVLAIIACAGGQLVLTRN